MKEGPCEAKASWLFFLEKCLPNPLQDPDEETGGFPPVGPDANVGQGAEAVLFLDVCVSRWIEEVTVDHVFAEVAGLEALEDVEVWGWGRKSGGENAANGADRNREEERRRVVTQDRLPGLDPFLEACLLFDEVESRIRAGRGEEACLQEEGESQEQLAALFQGKGG